jgi:hypothetical protein
MPRASPLRKDVVHIFLPFASEAGLEDDEPISP